MKKLFTHIVGMEVVIFFLLLGMLHLFYQTQALQERWISSRDSWRPIRPWCLILRKEWWVDEKEIEQNILLAKIGS